MEKFIYYAGYIANILMLLVIAFLLTQSYGSETAYILAMAIPPAISIFALYTGPDREERHLARLLRKATMRKSLKELSIAKTKSKPKP